MDEATIQQRIHELAAEERKQPLRWWYVSFADKQFRGVVVLMARGITDAARKCHKRGINPGGEVLAVPCTPETLPTGKVPQSTFN